MFGMWGDSETDMQAAIAANMVPVFVEHGLRNLLIAIMLIYILFIFFLSIFLYARFKFSYYFSTYLLLTFLPVDYGAS